MFIACLNRLLGGTWVLRERSRKSHIRIIRWFSRFVYAKALQAKGSWISLDAEFETIPLFPHGIYGIFISGGTSIGRNCVIFHHVTIGSNSLIDSSGLGAPLIGDDCYLGAGCKLIGKVTIGRHVRVGANAVVVRDVPDNSIVIGEQNIFTRDYPLNNKFYHKYNGRWRYFDNGKWYLVAEEHELELLESRFRQRVISDMNIQE